MRQLWMELPGQARKPTKTITKTKKIYYNNHCNYCFENELVNGWTNRPRKKVWKSGHHDGEKHSVSDII